MSSSPPIQAACSSSKRVYDFTAAGSEWHTSCRYWTKRTGMQKLQRPHESVTAAATNSSQRDREQPRNHHGHSEKRNSHPERNAASFPGAVHYGDDEREQREKKREQSEPPRN